MAEILLNRLIEGSIDSKIFTDGIESGNVQDQPVLAKELGDKSFLKEFVPCFLTFVKEKLSRNLSKNQILSCSPKRYSTSNKEVAKNQNNSRTSLLSKFDEQGGKARGLTPKSADSFMAKTKQKNWRSFSESNKKSNPSRNPKRVDLNSNTTVSQTRSTSAKLDIAPLTSTPQVNKQIQKRRITPTLVTPDKGSFHERRETQSLFENSPIIETSDSSLDSSGSVSGNFAFDRKIKNLEKSMRNRRRNEKERMPLSAFLESNERISGKKTMVVDASKPRSEDLGNFSKDSEKMFSDAESFESLAVKVAEKGESSVLENEDIILVKKISNMEQMTAFINIYACILLQNLISNISLELYFLYSVVNCSIEPHAETEADEVIFESVESCVYFAAKVLESARLLSAVFDVATLNLIAQNKRLQFLAPSLIKLVVNKLSDISFQNSSSAPQLSFSSSLGVPFQVEGNNRKAFSTDRYFYSFSKMRDKFYGLLRRWEENHLKNEWNMEKDLGEKFQVFFFEFTEHPTYSQFSQLFVSQLIEMSSQDFSGLLSRNEPSSASLLDYLKSSNPSKFQRLQERFFTPMTSQGPCPKPYFSDIETFFKLFIDKSCNYHFLVHLRDTLVCRILAINSSDFLLQFGRGDGTDDNEALMQARNDYSVHLTEARILSKFLGYIVFAPYESDNQSTNQNTDLLKGDIILQPFKPDAIIATAVEEGKLLITVPWMAQYLSLMDEKSLMLKVNQSAFCLLVQLYRAPNLRIQEAGLNGMFILFQLGWLFEQPHISSHAPFYQLLGDGSTNWNKQLSDWRSSNVTDFISRSLLLRFCPFINEVKNVLSKTGTGSLRKIKPLTHVDKMPVVDSEKILKENMIQDFFKYKPKYFKETADFVVDRFCNNLKLDVNTRLMPEVLKDATETLKKSVIIEEGKFLEIENLKQQNSAFLKQTLSISKSELEAKLQTECDGYCKESGHDVLVKMLPGDVDARVVDVAVKIVSYEVKQKMNEWTSHKLNELYEKELNTAFNRLLMGEVKRCNKSLNNSSSFM